jgi:hypothetical protein
MPRSPAVRRRRIDDVVHLAVPRVSRHIHRKLRLLAIRSDVTLRDLVIELIATHPRVVVVEDEFTEKPKA